MKKSKKIVGPYDWDDSGFLVACRNCNGESTFTNGMHRINRCEDCNGTHLVDEFYWQGLGCQAPPYWQGNVADPDGKIKYVEDTLDNILIDYPLVMELSLSPESGMNQTIKFNETGEVGRFYNFLPKLSGVTVSMILDDGEPIGWSWSYYKGSPKQIVFWTYIREDHRRKGYGSILFGKAKIRARKLHRPIRVQPWNDVSVSFFCSLNAISL